MSSPTPGLPPSTPTYAPVEPDSGQPRWPKQTERLHPLTPFIRGWIVFVAMGIYLGRELLNGGDGWNPMSGSPRILFVVLAAAVVIAATAGLVSWYFTRYVIDDEELRIESGAVFKSSKKVPFDRLQSVDIVQPFAARMFGLAELRMEVGAGDSVIKLHYLRRSDADRLRDFLLTRAHGQRASLHDQQGPGASFLTDLGADDQRLVVVDPGRLVGSFLLSSEWIMSVVGVVVVLGVTAYFDVVGFAIAGLIPMIIGLVTLVGRRLIGMFNFTLAESPRGLRAARGLTSLTSQSVPIDRIQGVRVVQSLLWRPFGWYKIEINILGYGNSGDEGGDSAGATSVLLPVADADQIRLVLSRILPGVDLDGVELHPSPPNARWVSWFDFWTLRYGYDDRVLVTEHGWLIHVRNVVPHAKTQSVRIEQGPLQRRLGLADVHLDLTRGPVSAVAHQIDVEAARALALSQLDRAKLARIADQERRSAAAVRADARDSGDAEVLARFGVDRSAFLGSGGESEVYALDEQRVLRIYRATHEAPERVTEQLRRLYDLWAYSGASQRLPIQVPQILDAGRIGHRFFTVDRRFPGRSLSGWLAGAEPAQRREVLLGYLDAAAILQQLPTPTPRFARLIGDDPREFGSLAELLTDQMTRTVNRSRQRLEQDVPGAIEVWNGLQQALIGRSVEPRFVHGDFCPPNVYVDDRYGYPRVTAVGDFSPHTLVADPLLDLTGAVAFLELEDYPEAAADAAWLTEEAVRRYGPQVAEWIGHYRVYFGFYFSDTYDFDPGTYAWCLRQLNVRRAQTSGSA